MTPGPLSRDALKRDPLNEARQRIAGTVRSIVVGDQPAEGPPVWDPTDPGLFPLDHAVRIVHSDAAMFIGGVRSLLLQSLHPRAMFGVATHSNFREDPLGRLQRTSAFLAATTFGSGSDATQAIDIVRAVHTRVNGTMPDGTMYSADDPHLLTWVHVTEVASFLDGFLRYGSQKLTPAQADEYVDGMATIGLRLGMETAPRSVEELHATIESYRPELATTEWSEEATLFLLSPPLPLATKPAYGLIFGAALASLPSWARNLLMLPLPPLAGRLAIAPAASVMTRALHWALTAPAPDSTVADPTVAATTQPKGE